MKDLIKFEFVEIGKAIARNVLEDEELVGKSHGILARNDGFYGRVTLEAYWINSLLMLLDVYITGVKAENIRVGYPNLFKGLPGAGFNADLARIWKFEYSDARQKTICKLVYKYLMELPSFEQFKKYSHE